MHLFPNRNRPRSSFDIKVGRLHLLEVTVHLVTHRRNAAHRKKLHKNKHEANQNGGNNKFRDEWDWYDTNREEINGEFLELLEASVLSRMFGKEMEEYYRREQPGVVPPENEEIGGVAAKNKTGRKRKGKATAATGSKKQSKTKKLTIPAAAALALEGDESDQKPEKDIYFAFGESIQLAYKKEAFKSDKSSRTLLLRSNRSNGDGKDKHDDSESTSEKKPDGTIGNSKPQDAGRFVERKKLSHRLLVWVGRSDAAAAAASGDGSSTAAATLNRPGEGMYRNEMIPISNLFRRPAEFIDFSDDEDE